jgi:hypothetical protein
MQLIALAVVLLCIVSWAHGTVILCLGADGHIVCEQVASKRCCKKSAPYLPSDTALHAGFDHCADVPAWVQKFASRNRRGPSRYKEAVAVRLYFLSSCLGMRSAQILRSLNTAFPDDPLSAALETVVLIV